MSYFLHRIQKTGGNFTKGIEVHDTLDSAILSYWGRMKTAYGKSENTFVSCMITDEYGDIVEPYNATWVQGETENKFFLHHIRMNGDAVDKDIDVLDNIDTAYGNLAAYMEYGYNNPRFPDVTMVSCYITDLLSGNVALMDRSWVKPTEPEPEPEEA